MNHLGDWLFSGLRWYRRLRGGHWERWHMEYPVCGRIWIRVEACSQDGGSRPYLGRGTPTCEGA